MLVSSRAAFGGAGSAAAGRDPIKAFVQSCEAAIGSEDGGGLASLLHFDALPGLDAAAAGTDVDAAVSRLAGAAMADMRAWTDMAAHHLRCLGAVHKGDVEAAAVAAHDALKSIQEALRASETNWPVPAMHALMRNAVSMLRRVEDDKAAAGMAGGAAELTSNVMATLRAIFGECFNHRLPPDQIMLSKKMGALAVANTIVAMLYRADQPGQCSIFQETVERHKLFPALSLFPRSQTVTYRYYMGMLAVWDESFDRADTLLTAALGDCHAEYAGNRRRILTALVPIRMYMRGTLPTPALLERYGLQGPFEALAAAFKAGDVAAWNAAMEANRDWYIQRGLFLLLERCSLLVQRTAFKRVCRHIAALQGTVQIKLPLLQAGLRGVGCDMSMEEVECVAANLIHRKLIRGYLSHKPPVLVLAKTDAFKPLPEVLAATGPAGRGPAIADI